MHFLIAQNFTCDDLASERRFIDNILRCFISGDSNLLIKAFIVHVRPLLEFISIIWSPSLKTDIELLEKVHNGLLRDCKA